MSTISVIIPTHNRQEWLPETIRSLVEQTRIPDEILIVDDGSQPPVEEAALRETFGSVVRVVRNDTPRGLAWVRHQGAQAARGDLLAQLDDDDLYAPETIERAVALLESDAELDLVFLSARGFGTNAAAFDELQPVVTRRVVELGEGHSPDPGLVWFGTSLMLALLKTVPVTFQHPVTRRRVWDAVSALRRRAYMLEPGVVSDEAAMHRISGPLRDSEWMLYYAASCTKSVLLDQPCYLVRCERQGGVSHPDKWKAQVTQGVNIKAQLHKAAQHLPEFARWRHLIRESSEQAHFDAAYLFHQRGERDLAWRNLLGAFRVQPRLRHCKLSLNLLRRPAA